MSLKSLAFNLVNSTTNSSPTLSRSHAYQLIAAAFGYQSYAAFSQTAVALFQCDQPNNIDRATLVKRCQQLSYGRVTNAIIEVIENFIEEYSIKAVPLLELIKELHQGILPCTEEQLLLSLEEQGHKTGLGNYALGFTLMSLVDVEDPPSSYWYNQLPAGRALTPDEEQFALEYKTHLERLGKARQCFVMAAERGSKLGLLGLATYFNDHQFFKSRIGSGDLPDDTYDPLEIALLAQDMGYDNQYGQWLFDACRHGNIEAIRTTVEHLAYDNPLLSHALSELSALLGNDIREDSYYAVDEHGNETDEDYGPIYADGYSGVDLPEIPNDDISVVKSLAAQWFKEIQETGKSQCSIN